jgi:general secretion pathway protein G
MNMDFTSRHHHGPRRSSRGTTQGGFTLVELLLVLVILAIIGAMVLPNIIGTGEGLKVRTATSSITRLSMSVENFYLDTGSKPDSLEELVDAPGDAKGWNGPYIKRALLKDPWGREWVYRNPGDHGEFDIMSLGADGQSGGEGKNADITSWE